MGFGVVALLWGETSAFLHARDFVMVHPGLREGLPLALFYTFKNAQLMTWVAVVMLMSLPYWRG